MSSREIPVDELSGHPLPLVPYEEGGRINRHHPAFPEKSPLLWGVGGLATRRAMTQDTTVHMHEAHHDYYRESLVPLPETEDEQFDYVTWATLGYIPTHGIDYVNGRPIIKMLSTEQRKRLCTEIRVSSNVCVRKFMAHYIVGQDLTHLQVDQLYGFLYPNNPAERFSEGKALFERAAEVATERLRVKYKKAYKQGLVDQSHGPKLSAAVAGHVFPFHQNLKILRGLHANLTKSNIPEPANLAEIFALRAEQYDAQKVLAA